MIKKATQEIDSQIDEIRQKVAKLRNDEKEIHHYHVNFGDPSFEELNKIFRQIEHAIGECHKLESQLHRKR